MTSGNSCILISSLRTYLAAAIIKSNSLPMRKRRRTLTYSVIRNHNFEFQINLINGRGEQNDADARNVNKNCLIQFLRTFL